MSRAHTYAVGAAAELSPTELWRRRQDYLAWRHEQREQGIDPDWIGSHEVDPVRCPTCEATIPWLVLKGWRD